MIDPAAEIKRMVTGVLKVHVPADERELLHTATFVYQPKFREFGWLACSLNECCMIESLAI